MSASLRGRREIARLSKMFEGHEGNGSFIPGSVARYAKIGLLFLFMANPPRSVKAPITSALSFDCVKRASSVYSF